MMKNFSFILSYYPIMMNLLMILILSIPSKNNKFNPINLTLLLIMLTIIITLKMNYLLNSWSSYILFLIMIGGLMIIFMYITSLSNNELFSFNYKFMLMNLIKLLILISMMIIYLNFNNNLNYWNNTNSMFYLNLNFYKNLNLHELYMMYFNYNTLFIMNYLFYSMICIMNICYKLKIPLRQLYF